MSAEADRAIRDYRDPAAGTAGPWYTNGTFGLTAGWDLDLWGRNFALKLPRGSGARQSARSGAGAKTRQLLAAKAAWRDSTGSGRRGRR